MADPTPLPASGLTGSAPDDERDRAIESLLIAGLDLYFACEYERAIHAWTRVLFLDRAHARARAYIDRARAVLAERQRETDELLHRGLAALDAGDTDHARTLLASAVQRGGAVEAAEVALERLGRLDVAGGSDEAFGAGGMRAARAPGRRTGSGLRVAPWFLAIASVLLLVIAGGFALRWRGFETAEPGVGGGDVALPASHAEPPVPHPSMAELAIRRARALFARGHLHEALVELDAVRADDLRRPEADRLKGDVQRALLAAVDLPPRAGAPPSAAPGRP
jgi:hypothetical protein